MQNEIQVSIIIPVHNVWHLTERCFESIVQYTPLAYELIVIDDQSSDETANGLVRFQSRHGAERVKIITNPVRGSYSKNNNKAASIARGEFLCLLNNDTLVTPYWLEPMINVLKGDATVGIVGNKHLCPNSLLLNHCGIAFDNSGRPWHLHPHTDPNAPAVNVTREVPALTFACVTMRRECFTRLGGLNESFLNGYEDCDLSLRTKSSGLKVVYTPASVIYHYGQSSPGRTEKDEQNWELFSSLWPNAGSGTLESIQAQDILYNADVANETDESARFPQGVHMAIDLGSDNAFTWAAAEMVLALSELGEPVSVAVAQDFAPGLDPEKKAALRKLVVTRPRRSCHIKLSHYWDHHFRQIIHGDVNIEFFCNNYRFRPGKHLDPWMRNALLNGYKKLSMSKFNRQILLEIGVPDKDILNVPLGYAAEIDTHFGSFSYEPPVGGRDVNLFVITNSHDLYRYGSDLLVRALGSAFTNRDPVVVHIKDYGKGADNNLLNDWIAEFPSFPRTVVHNEFVSKLDLLKLYTAMDVVVCPFRGEGFGLKIIDAMALGIPVMMPAFGGPTEYASQGSFIDLPFREVPVQECYDTKFHRVGEGAYWAEVNHNEFVAGLKRLVTNPSDLQVVGLAGMAAVRGKYTWKNTAEKLQNAIRIFSAQRVEKIASRRGPSKWPITVVIPTKDRNGVLVKTLEGYSNQTVPSTDFEIIVVNDYGDFGKLKELVDSFKARLTLRLLDNGDEPGPAAARNMAISRSRGNLILITGDDVIPSPRLLEIHLKAHQTHPGKEVGFVGYTPWHPDLDDNWLMRHLIGEGGQQFNYNHMHDMERTGFDRLYTSNVSFKRNFLIEQELMFSTAFQLAAFEDIELGYRLHFQGLELRYLPSAIGYHLHPMTVDSFLQRQRRVGKMLAVMCAVQPSFVPREHYRFIEILEFERAQKRKRVTAPIQSMEVLMRTQLQSVEDALQLFAQDAPVSQLDKRDSNATLQELVSLRKQLFNSLCQLMVTLGMSEGWAQSKEDAIWAKDYVSLTGLRGLLAHNFSEGNSASDERELRYLTSKKEALGHDQLSIEALRFELSELKRTSIEVNQDRDRQLEREFHELRTAVNDLHATRSDMQKWISDFSITGRVKSKVQSIIRISK